MKTYAFKTVKCNRILSSAIEEHREAILQYAAQGYRYVGYIPVYVTNEGQIRTIDLIFEKDNEKG